MTNRKFNRRKFYRRQYVKRDRVALRSHLARGAWGEAARRHVHKGAIGWDVD